jgi:hypothetical protein
MLKRDEDGNIIIAVLIIFVLVTITSALAYRVIGNQSLVLTRQNTSAGVAAADAGISDALFRLDQGTAYEGNGSEFYVKNISTCSSDTRCVGQTIPGAPGVSYVARQVSSSKWVIESTGTVNGKVGAVQETVTRSQEYPFALFGNTSLTFNGNASAAFSTYNSSAVASSSNPNSSGNVAIGSNGTITCNGGLGSNVTAAYYGTGGIGSLSSSCGTPESFSYVYNLPTPTAPASSLSCPDNGNLGSGISGAPTTLSAGTYLCTSPVTISGLLNVSGPVSLYIILDPSVYGSSTNALTITRNSYVNDMSDYCAANSNASGCSPTPDLPNSEYLQILTNSNGTVGNDNGQGYDFGGILYAPQASLTQDGCKSQYYGSVTINTLTCNGGPHLYVSYDTQLNNLYGAWTAGDYTVISPSSVAIP